MAHCRKIKGGFPKIIFIVKSEGKCCGRLWFLGWFGMDIAVPMA